MAVARRHRPEPYPDAHGLAAQNCFLAPLPNNRLAQVIGITLIGMFMKIAQDAIGAIKLMVNNKFTYNGRLRVRGELFDRLQNLHLG